ncbi:MAG: BatD family protein [Gemmatimonadaceae bacterium]
MLLFAQIGVAQPRTVQFETRVVPDTVYAGQQVTYEAVTLVDDATRSRLKANPEYTPADVAGVTVYDFPFDTASISDVSVGGARFRRYVYRRALFPLSPGAYQVPPATLRYAVPEDAGSFSPAHTVSIPSAADSFVAIPLPTSGRPLGFKGGVGELRDTLWTDGATARLGDTFVVTVRIAGIGNLNLLPRPPLQIDWAAIVPGRERVAWDSTGSVVRGSKEFDWTVTPRVSGDLSIPPVRYDYFDPTTRRYEVASTALLPITVALAPAPVTDNVGQVRDTIGDSPFPTIMRIARDNSLVIAVVASAVLLAIGIAVAMGRRRARATPEDE